MSEITVTVTGPEGYGYGPFNVSPWGRRDHRPVTAGEWGRIADRRRRVRRPIHPGGAPPARLANGLTVAEVLDSRR